MTLSAADAVIIVRRITAQLAWTSTVDFSHAAVSHLKFPLILSQEITMNHSWTGKVECRFAFTDKREVVK